MLKQISNDTNVISFYCRHQRSLTNFSRKIYIRIKFLHQKSHHLQISIKCCSVEWSHFGIFSQLYVDKLWSFSQKFL